jgi:hypothetical protein
MAMMSASHPLAKRHSVSCAQLADEVRVNMQDVPDAWRKWWSLDRSPAGDPVPYGQYITSFEEQLEIAASNQAISIVPECASRMHQRLDIAFVLINDAEHSEILLCAREDDDSRTVDALFSAAAAVAERGRRTASTGPRDRFELTTREDQGAHASHTAKRTQALVQGCSQVEVARALPIVSMRRSTSVRTGSGVAGD